VAGGSGYGVPILVGAATVAQAPEFATVPVELRADCIVGIGDDEAYFAG
jgi:hypothetical protein